MPSMNDVLAVILGGGRGSRLYPLTRDRSKPAVPIAGKYRLIDIPISNCIHSGIFHIAVLTQFNSVSLHRHISRTYHFDAFHHGWVQIWAAEQTMQYTDWYQGTADAVRKQLFEIRSARSPYVLILAGDHLYRMDYEPMARFHWESDADITVAVQPVRRAEAPRLGILKRGRDGRLTDFAEKPNDPAEIEAMVSRDDEERPLLGSMGIYLFKTEVLFDVLKSTSHADFGGEVIPSSIGQKAVYGFDFDGYWEDIGTIRSFYETNLALACPNPPLDLFDPQRPIFTHARFLPCSTIEDSRLHYALVAEGCCIQKSDLENVVIGLRSQVKAGCVVRNSIIMGSDYYDPSDLPAGSLRIGIGPGCHIDGAIIDKNARIGAGVRIQPYPRGTNLETELWVVRDGIVVIPKNSAIPDGTVIGPGEGD